MYKLPLPNNKFALIDLEDVTKVNFYNSWHLTGPKKNYVAGYSPGGALDRKKVYLHRVVLEVEDNFLVDHINKDTLDCRKHNLRRATQTQNGAWNCRADKLNVQGKAKGVKKRYNRYIARLSFNSKEIYLGSFATTKEAAEAYNKAALLYFGEFASLNNLEVL